MGRKPRPIDEHAMTTVAAKHGKSEWKTDPASSVNLEKFIAAFDGNVKGTCDRIGIKSSFIYRVYLHPQVQLALKLKYQKVLNDLMMDAAERASMLAEMIRTGHRPEMDPEDGEISYVRLENSAYMKAFDMLNKMSGDYSETIHHEGQSTNITVVTSIPRAPDEPIKEEVDYSFLD